MNSRTTVYRIFQRLSNIEHIVGAAHVALCVHVYQRQFAVQLVHALHVFTVRDRALRDDPVHARACVRAAVDTHCIMFFVMMMSSTNCDNCARSCLRFAN